jgi:hypothetical protein
MNPPMRKIDLTNILLSVMALLELPYPANPKILLP